jgi:hypothetical protein
MRLSRRILLSHCTTIVLLLTVFSSATLAQTSSAPGRPIQLGEAAPAAQAQLPPKWNEAVHALAEKIAGAAGPSHEIALDMKNISTLTPIEFTAIRQALQNQLRQRQLVVTPVSLSEAQVQITLSEGTQGRFFVIEYHHGAEKWISLIPAPNERALIYGRQKDALTLSAKLVWEQPEKFLDFALFDGIPELKSNLLVVEPEHLTFYNSVDNRWSVSRTIQVPRSRPTPRDIQGRIDITKNEIKLSDAECSGRLTNADDVHCRSLGGLSVWMTGVYFPGREEAQMTPLPQKCGDGQFILASGTGDWTQPDYLQPFERAQGEMPPVSAGNTIYFDGPVLSLVMEKDTNTTRAVVHNLKTGNYEAYLVTATCSH